jgi:hypothetical protein
MPSDTWFLFIHDTCKFGPKSKKAVEDLIESAFEQDIIWLCSSGQGNICIIRNIVPYGAGVYNGMKMTKEYAIEIEHGTGKDSIKSFPCRQLFLLHQNTCVEANYVYDDIKTYGKRVTSRYDEFDLEKYYRVCD